LWDAELWDYRRRISPMSAWLPEDILAAFLIARQNPPRL
jgi:hypothetical protein